MSYIASIHTLKVPGMSIFLVLSSFLHKRLSRVIQRVASFYLRRSHTRNDAVRVCDLNPLPGSVHITSLNTLPTVSKPASQPGNYVSTSGISKRDTGTWKKFG